MRRSSKGLCVCGEEDHLLVVMFLTPGREHYVRPGARLRFRMGF
jgi:hypothetical protein